MHFTKKSVCNAVRLAFFLLMFVVWLQSPLGRKYERGGSQLPAKYTHTPTQEEGKQGSKHTCQSFRLMWLWKHSWPNYQKAMTTGSSMCYPLLALWQRQKQVKWMCFPAGQLKHCWGFPGLCLQICACHRGLCGVHKEVELWGSENALLLGSQVAHGLSVNE